VLLATLILVASPQCIPHPFGWVVSRPFAITADDYPDASVRAGETGTVAVSFDACPDGRSQNCQIEISSGHARLDRRTCELVERRGHFPALAPGRHVLVHEWQLPNK
jgi:TonB family protein